MYFYRSAVNKKVVHYRTALVEISVYQMKLSTKEVQVHQYTIMSIMIIIVIYLNPAKGKAYKCHIG